MRAYKRDKVDRRDMGGFLWDRLAVVGPDLFVALSPSGGVIARVFSHSDRLWRACGLEEGWDADFLTRDEAMAAAEEGAYGRA